MKVRTYIGLGLLALMAMLGSTVFAQDVSDDLLAGPTVQDEEVTQQDMRAEHARLTGKDNKNFQNQEQLRIWMRTLQSLDLTKEQRAEIESLVDQLEKAKKVFQKKHGMEMQNLRQQSREARTNGSNIPDDVGTRTRELLAMSPKTKEYQSKAWALLSEDQRNDFQKKYQTAIEALKKLHEQRNGKRDPMMNEMDGPRRGSGPDERSFQDRDTLQKEETRVGRDMQDEALLRRTRFLRRLRRLQEEN